MDFVCYFAFEDIFEISLLFRQHIYVLFCGAAQLTIDFYGQHRQEVLEVSLDRSVSGRFFVECLVLFYFGVSLDY
jgi:hypothetical protein